MLAKMGRNPNFYVKSLDLGLLVILFPLKHVGAKQNISARQTPCCFVASALRGFDLIL